MTASVDVSVLSVAFQRISFIPGVRVNWSIRDCAVGLGLPDPG